MLGTSYYEALDMVSPFIQAIVDQFADMTLAQKQIRLLCSLKFWALYIGGYWDHHGLKSISKLCRNTRFLKSDASKYFVK